MRHLRFYILTVLTILLCVVSASSQNLRNYQLKGKINDQENKALSFSSVVISYAKDSVLCQFTNSAEDGTFKLEGVKPDRYLLQITMLGFKSVTKTIDVEGGNKVIDLGIIKLETESTGIKEVEARAINPITIKKDTVEYDAGSFAAEPNDDVEGLLKKLPGVEVDKDGNIKAHGEEVKKILVDGKEFFGDDPKLATKNLPADAIEKVQVFNKKSEQAEFTGIDDGSREKTINLTLKEDKKKGAFGKIEGGYGTDDRYKLKANINRFSKKSQLSTIVGINNINEQSFSIQDYFNMVGIQNLMNSSGGITLSSDDLPFMIDTDNGLINTGSGGLNLNRDFGKKVKVHANYFYTDIRSDVLSSSFRENFLGSGEVFITDEESDRNTINRSHRFSGNMDFEIDSMSSLKFNVNIGALNGDNNTSSLQRTLVLDSVLTNSSESQNNNLSDRLNMNADLTYRRKMKKVGRSFVTKISGLTGYGNVNDEIFYQNFFPFETLYDTLEQNQVQRTDKLDYAWESSYIEPIGKGKYLDLSFAHQNFSKDRRKDFYDITNNGQLRTFNTNLSTDYTNDYIVNRPSLTLKINKKKHVFNIGSGLQQSNLKGDIRSLDQLIDKQFLNVLPSAFWNYNMSNTKRLSLNYSTNINAPSIDQLQPVINNSNPLSIYEGNPDLKVAYRHNASAQFMSFSQFTFTNLFLTLNGSYTRNKIVNSTSIDSLLRRNIKPVNVKDDYAMNSYGSFETPLKFIKSKISLGTNFGYNRGILPINGFDNIMRRLDGGVDLTLENRKKTKYDGLIGAEVNRSITTYSEASNLNQAYTSLNLFSDLSFKFLKKWRSKSSFDYTLYYGEAFRDNPRIPILKSQVSRNILKNDRGIIKLSVFDLLNKNLGVQRNANLNYIETLETQTIGRYFMLSFTYKLNKFSAPQSGGGIFIKEGR